MGNIPLLIWENHMYDKPIVHVYVHVHIYVVYVVTTEHCSGVWKCPAHL